MKKVAKTLSGVVIVGTLFSFSVSALAENACLDGNTTTCITEETVNLLGFTTDYVIENNSEQRLWAFGVSNSAYSANTEAGNVGWNSTYISKYNWDNTNQSFVFFDALDPNVTNQDPGIPTEIWYTGSAYTTEVESNPEDPIDYFLLGSFESLFGTEDNGVSVYYNQYLQDSPLTTGITRRYNLFSEDPESEFSTFTSGGAVVTTSVVPEPETYAMLLAGLGLLGFVGRRKLV